MELFVDTFLDTLRKSAEEATKAFTGLNSQRKRKGEGNTDAGARRLTNLTEDDQEWISDGMQEVIQGTSKLLLQHVDKRFRKVETALHYNCAQTDVNTSELGSLAGDIDLLKKSNEEHESLIRLLQEQSLKQDMLAERIAALEASSSSSSSNGNAKRLQALDEQVKRLMDTPSSTQSEEPYERRRRAIMGNLQKGSPEHVQWVAETCLNEAGIEPASYHSISAVRKQTALWLKCTSKMPMAFRSHAQRFSNQIGARC